MNELREVLKSSFKAQRIDLRNRQWSVAVPPTAGWYFIETNTPRSVLATVPSPPSEYVNANGRQKKCRNYDIGTRARSYADLPDGARFVLCGQGLRPIYSGMAKNLGRRASDHTFGHSGTAGLALAGYERLLAYEWSFRYIENPIQTQSPVHREVLLKLGEQIWRSIYGWPQACPNVFRAESAGCRVDLILEPSENAKALYPAGFSRTS